MRRVVAGNLRAPRGSWASITSSEASVSSVRKRSTVSPSSSAASAALADTFGRSVLTNVPTTVPGAAFFCVPSGRVMVTSAALMGSFSIAPWARGWQMQTRISCPGEALHKSAFSEPKGRRGRESGRSRVGMPGCVAARQGGRHALLRRLGKLCLVQRFPRNDADWLRDCCRPKAPFRQRRVLPLILKPFRLGGGEHDVVSVSAVTLMAAPASTSVPLFELGRNKNANVVEYAARVTPDGRLDDAKPFRRTGCYARRTDEPESSNVLSRSCSPTGSPGKRASQGTLTASR